MLANLHKVKERGIAHFCEVNGLQSELPEAFPSVDIGLRRAGDTTTTKLGADSILSYNICKKTFVLMKQSTPQVHDNLTEEMSINNKQKLDM